MESAHPHDRHDTAVAIANVRMPSRSRPTTHFCEVTIWEHPDRRISTSGTCEGALFRQRRGFCEHQRWARDALFTAGLQPLPGGYVGTPEQRTQAIDELMARVAAIEATRIGSSIDQP